MPFRALVCLLSTCLLLGSMRPLVAAPPADRIDVLRRGVNITNWFRFPPSLAPAALQAYLGDTAIAELRRAGFTFVRLAVQPEILLQPDGTVDGQREALVTEAVARLEREGLVVVVELHPASWRLERSAVDRAKLQAVWQTLAYALRPFDPRLTFPEVLNEPVFEEDPAAWEALQASVLATIRAALPASTVVLTGSAWGGLDGCSERWDSVRVQSRIAAAGAWGRGNGVAVLAGEFGARDRLNAPARLAWLRTVRAACEAQGIGWALWGYEDSFGFDAPRPPRNAPALDPHVLHALGLPQ